MYSQVKTNETQHHSEQDVQAFLSLHSRQMTSSDWQKLLFVVPVTVYNTEFAEVSGLV